MKAIVVAVAIAGLVERLQAVTVEADLVVLQGAGHGLKGADAEQADRARVEFLDAHLKP